MLDIRMPISALFLIVGVLLALYGAGQPPAAYANAGFNLDLWWGATMALFGVAVGIWRFRSTRPSPREARTTVPATRSEAASSREP